jgi:hypothetical protein
MSLNAVLLPKHDTATSYKHAEASERRSVEQAHSRNDDAVAEGSRSKHDASDADHIAHEAV